jgi:transposase
MEASGGYEREWAKALRKADIEALVVDPKRVRNFARSAGRLAKNDPIDAEMIAWFAETFIEARGQAYDAAREELAQVVRQPKATSTPRPGRDWRTRPAQCCGRLSNSRVCHSS